MIGLSRSNEDYLEAILVLGLRQGIVRVRDLADHLQVKAPSVATAVKKLAADGLVRHEHYGHVELTAQGFELAEAVHRRHKLLFRFLHDFLGLDESTSAQDACEIEHWLSPQTITRIIQFLEFMEACPYDEEPPWLTGFHHYIKTGEVLSLCQHAAGSASHRPAGDGQTRATMGDLAAEHKRLTLADLPVGQEAEVLQVGDEVGLRRFLLELGLVPGARIQVVGVPSPEGPIEIVVRGDHVSLQKAEASRITVKQP
mgnify:FL=1